jgi:hypothetical protein
MLGNAIRREVPRVTGELTRQRDAAQKALDWMSKSLETTKNQAHFLAEIAQQLEEMARDTFRGEYDGPSLFGTLHGADSTNASRRLRAEIREMNRIFACITKLCGKKHEIN